MRFKMEIWLFFGKRAKKKINFLRIEEKNSDS
jgi:hypothetical protein